jgi:cell division transport system permease protein
LAISTGYVLRETGSNLRRNLLMTLSAILTMAVSLTALGGVLIMRQAINKASVQWRGGVELAIFMQPQASQVEIAAIGHELSSSPAVKSWRFVDKPHAFSEFKTIFGNNNDIVGVLTVNDMPTSYRVVPSKAQDISQLGQQFNGQPGVLKVSYAQQEIANLLHQFNRWRWVGSVVATLVMIGAIALIINTIQLAIFARRREVAVMKLVGATNMFIRVPFMLEGFVHGVAGAACAIAVTYFVRDGIASLLPSQQFLGTSQLYVTSHEALMTGLILLAVGALVGVLGSWFAVRRYLSV